MTDEANGQRTKRTGRINEGFIACFRNRYKYKFFPFSTAELGGPCNFIAHE